MRVFLFFFCLLAVLSGNTQSFQKVPLQIILADAPNDFNAFKGELSMALEDDSFYASTVIVEGSKNNEITLHSGRRTQYHAYIADSATKKAAAKLVEEWRSKIKTASPGYVEEVIRSRVQKRTSNGYRFSKLMANGLCTISIVCSKREIDNFYWVLLTVTRQGKAVAGEQEEKE